MSCEQPRHLGAVTVPLPWAKPPLSLNDRGASRGAVMAKNARTQDAQRVAMLVCRRVRRPEGAGYLRVQLHYLPASNARRDTDNLVATLKPVADGLAGGSTRTPGLGLVADDIPSLMGKPEPVIWPRKRGDKAAMWLVLDWFDHAPCPYHDGCDMRPDLAV